MSLFVLEGLDGSGKGTQLTMLVNRLKDLGVSFHQVDFPDYQSRSSEPVKMYLNGEFGENPKEVNPYAACTFYAVDRFASYTTSWKKKSDCGHTIIANRYISSNIVYQMPKIEKSKWDEFIDWVIDLECNKFCLPNADCVIYLDMPIDISQKLITKRYNGNESQKDIHEKNKLFLTECREAAMFAANKLSWKIIDCSENGEPKSIDRISDEIFDIVKGLI